MFYEVRVFDPKGQMKKVLSGKQLSKKYWDDFQNQLKGQATTGLFKKKGRKSSRKDLLDDERLESYNDWG